MAKGLGGGLGDSAPPDGARRSGIALAALVGLQFLGYLLIWLVFHAFQRLKWPLITSEILVSTGWHYPGSAYAVWFAKLPFLGAAADARVSRKFLLAAGFALASAGYLGSLWLVQRRSPRLSTTRLAGTALLLALPLLLLPQMPSTDLWSYVMYGRVAVLHGGNPFVNLPAAYPQDPFLSRVYWKTVPSLYGPAWVAACIGLTRVAQFLGGAPWAYVLTFKGFMLGCHLLNAVLVRRILRSIRPGRETLGTLLYAWNPLLLFECVGSGHNDCFMLTLLLAGIAFAAAGRGTAAAGWMMAAGLAKLPGMLALPAFSLCAARNSQRPVLTLARQVLMALTVAVALYAPFWKGTETFRGTAHAPNLKIMNHSPDAGLAKWIERYLTGTRPREWWEGDPPPGSIPDRVRSGVRHGSLFCFFLCLAALSLWPVRDRDEWLDRMVWIFVAYLLLAAYQFNAWYGTWLVPLAALVRKPSPLLLLSSLVLLVYYLPLDFSGRSALFFWPLLLLVLWQVPRLLGFARRPAVAGENVFMKPEDTDPSDPSDPSDSSDAPPVAAWPMARPSARSLLPRLGVVTPLANEERTVEEFLRRTLAQMGPGDRLFCVLDNVSKDRTRALVAKASAADSRVVLVWAPENRCVKDAYFRGYREALAAGCRWVLEMDGGLSHLPEQMPRFVAAMEAGADYAAGSRFCRGGRFRGKFSRRCVSWGGSRLSNLLLGTRMKDMCSGFECFTREALSHVVAQGVKSRANFFQTEVRFLLRDWNWVEVPITYHGPPKGLPGATIKEALGILWSLRKEAKEGSARRVDAPAGAGEQEMGAVPTWVSARRNAVTEPL